MYGFYSEQKKIDDLKKQKQESKSLEKLKKKRKGI